MTIFGLIVLIVVICAIVYLIQYIQIPPPFNWVVPTLVVLVLIFFLFSLLGVGGGLGLNSRI